MLKLAVQPDQSDIKAKHFQAVLISYRSRRYSVATDDSVQSSLCTSERGFRILMNGMNTVNAHCEELGKSESWIFKGCLRLKYAQLPPEHARAAYKTYASIADFVVIHGLNRPGSDIGTALEKIKSPAIMIEYLKLWLQLLELCRGRRAQQFVINFFWDWAAKASGPLHGSFSELMTMFVRVFESITKQRMAGLIDELSKVQSEDVERLRPIARQFGLNDSCVLLAIGCTMMAEGQGESEFRRGLRSRMIDLGIPVSPEGNEFIRILGKLGERFAKGRPALWIVTAGLLMDIARKSVSSAQLVGKELVRMLVTRDEETSRQYAIQFRVMVQHCGISSIHFCLKRLWRLCCDDPIEAKAFVSIVAQIAENCGESAAHWFLLGRTRTSKEILATGVRNARAAGTS